MDAVFKALSDPTRRQLLDRLHERAGQTLGELCRDLGMRRQSVTQHLGVLEAANLVTCAWRGREKLHYLNPVPLHEIQDRWIDKFERPRLRALSGVKRAAEGAMSAKPNYVYVIYIHATPERVWDALTDAELTAAYWGHRNVSDWVPGAEWRHVRTDGSGIADVVGEVLEADPPRRLVMTFGSEAARATFEIVPHADIVKLTVTHEGVEGADYEAVSRGWPAVLSNLKSLLETGRVLPQAPWEMDAERMA
jgi:uncharacterized protein YndB with AHSA1/START domain/DNA-binding transcriptional ArsR family regulator